MPKITAGALLQTGSTNNQIHRPMFGVFKKQEDEGTADVKLVRDQLLRFIREQLQQWEGGEGRNIRNMHLYLFPPATERGVYEAAIYHTENDRFKNEEVQRLADDYAVDLPAEWNFEVVFGAAPEDAVQASGLPAALVVATRQRKAAGAQNAKALVRVLQGEAEQQQYAFDASSGKITIGRDKTVQAADGFHRENRIAFLATSQDERNKFVSRQHAHIEWDADAGAFLLFADEGGIPPRNKVKVRPQGGEAVKLQSTHIGYTLRHGDQIILGDSALLEFGYA